MGGHAIKTVPIRRYNRREFDNISELIPKILLGYFKKVAVPLFFESKETFGDLDVLVSTDDFEFYGGIRAMITEVFKPDEIHHNGNCWSFNFQEFQIDIITTTDENFDANLNYLNYNDLGNLMGKLAHAMGIKYGQSGLFYRHRYEDQKLGDISLTKNLSEICEVLDLDVKVIENGFTELEEIFIFITSSKYFDWKRVQYDQLDRVNRERDKKRATYAAFIDWIDEHVRDDEHTFEDINKKKILKDMNNRFPEARLELNIRHKNYMHCKNLYIKAKFNGKMAMDACGFEGKELGDKLNIFTDFINDNHGDYSEYIMRNSTEDIIEKFVQVSCNDKI